MVEKSKEIFLAPGVVNLPRRADLGGAREGVTASGMVGDASSESAEERDVEKVRVDEKDRVVVGDVSSDRDNESPL